MRNWDEVREVLSRYYEGNTLPAEERQLKEWLQAADLPKDLQAEAQLLGWYKAEQAITSPLSERELLSTLPGAEEKPLRRLWPLLGQLAAAVAMLLIGYGAGNLAKEPTPAFTTDASTELTAMRQELSQLKDMLQQGGSTSQRLQAVNVAAETSKPDAELLMALIHTMHFDDNVNVRMAAVEALLNYRQHPQVRQALIHSLSIQTDANVQLMLIQGLTQMNEKEAVPQMQELLKNPDLQHVVRQHIQESISILI